MSDSSPQSGQKRTLNRSLPPIPILFDGLEDLYVSDIITSADGKRVECIVIQTKARAEAGDVHDPYDNLFAAPRHA
jgi:hypothetical protein